MNTEKIVINISAVLITALLYFLVPRLIDNLENYIEDNHYSLPLLDKVTFPEMIYIEGGQFLMGSPSSEKYSRSNENQHLVTVNNFSIGKTEVTRKQWASVMGGESYGSCGPNCPIDDVTYKDIKRYIKRLNEVSGRHFRLPTEAEWEYACRANASPPTEYCGSNDVDAVGWHGDNPERKIRPVALKSPNSFGLYDMSGNVAEWTCSEYKEIYDGKAETECAETPQPALRNGDFLAGHLTLRAASRLHLDPKRMKKGFRGIGFRLVE